MADKANPIQVQKFLKGVRYPAKKDDLVEKARSLKADQIVLQTLERLPDQSYDSPAAVAKGIGGLK